MNSESLNIDSLLRTASENKASDLHLKVGNYPNLRVDGDLRPLTQHPRMSPEDMLNTTEYIRDCIVNPEKTHLIKEALAAGFSQYSMQTFDQSLYDLYSRGLITLEEALINSTNPNEFKLRIAGIRTTTDDARDEMERVSQVERFAKK